MHADGSIGDSPTLSLKGSYDVVKKDIYLV